MAAPLEFQVHIDAAQAYTISKGRMPRDVHELREWLAEFAEFKTRQLDAVVDSFREHMLTCTRPWILPKETNEKLAREREKGPQ